MYKTDKTHDANLTSWIDSANHPGTDFSPQNLPFCRFRVDEKTSVGVGIGDSVLNLNDLADAGLVDDAVGQALAGCDDLSGLMALDPNARLRLRERLSQLVTVADSDLARDQSLQQSALLARSAVEFLMPVNVPDYTDFYASLFHATNVGSMFRPDNPLLPNWKHIPIGYHGRASSLVPGGTPIQRPAGQMAPTNEGDAPGFGPCKMLDYELEVGVFVGQGNALGSPIPMSQIEQHMFGIALVNDWSARDMQRWEYQPLGPFLAKSFATSVSPWIVTMEALAPFRTAPYKRGADDPQPLPYLTSGENSSSGGVDLTLEVLIATKQMRDAGTAPQRLSIGSFGNMYWTLGQMLAHHSSNGCNMRTGDLLASGTVSGPERGSRGCFLELTWDGEYGKPVPGSQRTPLKMPTGEERTFLQDGDEIIIRGWCERKGFRRIGLGECRGVILPAISPA